MTAHRRPFRIEIAEPRQRTTSTTPERVVEQRMERILDEVGDLKRAVEELAGIRPGPRGTNVMEPWAGVDEIQDAISATRSEISALRAKGVTNPANRRAADELDAVVSDTETATETILASAEEIDTLVQTLVSQVDNAGQSAAAEIQDNVVKIFEACNFQDISGQRISKVVGLLQFIESRLRRMEEVWDIRDDVETSPIATVDGADGGDRHLLNGPALAIDAPVSQDEIDSMFQ